MKKLLLIIGISMVCGMQAMEPEPTRYAQELPRTVYNPALHLSPNYLLMYGSQEGDSQIIMQALCAGASANINDRRFYTTPLHLAAKSGNVGAVRLLAGNYEASCYQMELILGHYPIGWSAHFGHAHIVQYFLDTGRPGHVNTTGFGGVTLLQTAVEQGRLGVAQLLLSRGADVKLLSEQDPLVKGMPELEYVQKTRTVFDIAFECYEQCETDEEKAHWAEICGWVGACAIRQYPQLKSKYQKRIDTLLEEDEQCQEQRARGSSSGEMPA